ncbi:hypothetical protein [Myxococcus sp. AB056]|uniref:hypothetical protein n=1 Tax=Myxococcus sp. AB056 TaxID=2562792 RepID=UPI00114700A0|nr:hypothetical protein [Myxococcus sp. AB056]
MKRALMLRFVAIIALLTTTPTLANEEAESPAPIAESNPPLSREEALEQYELRHIGFDEYIAVTLSYSPLAVRSPPSRWTVPYEGKYKKPLEGEAFYQKLGRDDLVAEYQSRSATKLTLKIVGGVVMVGGLVYGIATPGAQSEDCELGPDFSACIDRNFAAGDRKRNMFLVGMGVSLVGVGLLGWGIFYNPHPIASSEARELADGHNKRLRQELGLSDVPAPAPGPRKRPYVIQARLTPVFGPNSGGLLVDGRF